LENVPQICLAENGVKKVILKLKVYLNMHFKHIAWRIKADGKV
jgi:hypothetical protein